MLYVFGDYTLDTQGYALSRAGASVHVRPKVFQVLAYLLEHRDRVVPKPELMEHVWPGQSVSDEPLDSCPHTTAKVSPRREVVRVRG